MRTRAALRDALLALIEEQAVEHITIRDISARAGAGYATFFRHYVDKAALLHDLAATEIAELLQRALPILVAEDTRASCIALCRYVDQHRQLWSALLTGGAAATLREEFIRQARAIAAGYQQPGAWLPAELAVVFGVSGVIELLTYWLHHPQDFTLEQIAELVERLVIAPVLQAPSNLTAVRAAAASRAQKPQPRAAAPSRAQKKRLPAAAEKKSLPNRGTNHGAKSAPTKRRTKRR